MELSRGGIEQVRVMMREGRADAEIHYYFREAVDTVRALLWGIPPAGPSERIRAVMRSTGCREELEQRLQAESWVPLSVIAVTSGEVALKAPNPKLS